MNTNLKTASASAAPDATVTSTSVDAALASQAAESDRAPLSPITALAAFFAIVFASMVAVAAVVSNDIALMVVGL